MGIFPSAGTGVGAFWGVICLRAGGLIGNKAAVSLPEQMLVRL